MVLRHVSILKDHPQGVCLYLAKVTELFKSIAATTPDLTIEILNSVF